MWTDRRPILATCSPGGGWWYEPTWWTRVYRTRRDLGVEQGTRSDRRAGRADHARGTEVVVTGTEYGPWSSRVPGGGDGDVTPDARRTASARRSAL